MATPFKYPRRFFDKHKFGPGSNRRRKLISGAIGVAVVSSSVAVVWLIFALVAHFTFNRPEVNFASHITHISAANLKKQVVTNYPWKVFWEGPLDSKQFVFQQLVEGVVQITYIAPNGLDVPASESFIVYSARSEADRMNVVRRINPMDETTDTTPAGNKIVFNASNMVAVRIYLKNGIVAIQFPTPQTIESFKSMADSLVAIN